MPRLRTVVIAGALVAPSIVATGAYLSSHGQQDLFGDLLVPEAARAVRAEASPACPENSVAASSFTDLGPFADHVNCLVQWDIVEGKSPTTYEPEAVVTRAQAAAFTARALTAVGGSLPEGQDVFDDDDDSTFEAHINQLANGGVLDVPPNGSFVPGAPMTAGEAADLLAAAFRHRAGGDIDSDALLSGAGAGTRAETNDTALARDEIIRRGQLAMLVTRWLDRAIADGVAQLPSATAPADRPGRP